MRAPTLLRAVTFALSLGATLSLAPRVAVAAAGDLDARWQTADRLACELAARTRDIPALERCTANLYAAAPRDGKTIEMQWALALARGQRHEARDLVTRARASALPSEGVDRMEDATNALLPEPPSTAARVVFVVFCTLLLAGAGLGTILALRRGGAPRQTSRWWPTT